ncbi:MAG: hypothetical protein K6F17_08745 [Lachnospiraceae bacterium]|nr:hypothetical protein [Lachnospiraceae bacterium]
MKIIFRAFGIIMIKVAIILIAAILIYLIYMGVYTCIINKRIKSGKVVKKKGLLGAKDAALAFNTMVLLFTFILYINSSIRYIESAERVKDRTSRNEYMMADVSDPNNIDFMQGSGRYYKYKKGGDYSYLSKYSVEANPGYIKEVIEGDMCTFTLFKRSADPDSFHPDFLCFIDYKGEREDLEIFRYFSFTKKGSSNTLPLSAGGSGSVKKRVLCLGYLAEDSEAVIDIYALTYEAFEQFMEDDEHKHVEAKDYAMSSDRLVISFDD